MIHLAKYNLDPALKYYRYHALEVSRTVIEAVSTFTNSGVNICGAKDAFHYAEKNLSVNEVARRRTFIFVQKGGLIILIISI